MPRLLLVEDDMALLSALPPAISRRLPDLHIDTAGSANAALTLVHTHHYDLIVTVLVMSGGDGLQLLEMLWQELSAVPVILITGMVEGSHPTVPIKNAVIVRKPFKTEDLIADIQKALMASS